jgi:hypothetical protein
MLDYNLRIKIEKIIQSNNINNCECVESYIIRLLIENDKLDSVNYEEILCSILSTDGTKIIEFLNNKIN